MALATMTVLRRNVVPLTVRRAVGRPDRRRAPSTRPTARATRSSATANAQAFLRALYLQLALAPSPPDVRPDLLLVLVVGAAHDQPVVPDLTYSLE